MPTEKHPETIVIIPAYNPPADGLWNLVQELTGLNVERILIVNDGSNSDRDDLFNRLKNLPNCDVLYHAVNLGKGRALKTAFNFVLTQYPNASVVVTADADSQHKPKDIINVINSSLGKNSFTIGVRSFGEEVPFRSKLGNVLTRHIFRFLIGTKISDTQSGLRAIPVSLLPHLLRISGEQYEYELAMLIAMRDLKVKIIEVPIDTVYLNNNESSKFNPFIDSMKIYFVLFRFLFSSLLSAFIDFFIFLIVMFFTDSILISLVVSRIIVSIINYFVNLRLVFKKTGNSALIMVKYYILLVFMAGLSYILIKLLSSYGIPVASAKILAETILFAISFTLQRDYVFRNATNEMTDEKN